MSNKLNIFGGWAYVSLYDATNGFLHLSQSVEYKLAEKPQSNITIEGQVRVYAVNNDLKLKIPESDQDLLDDLNTRVAYKQDIYIMCNDSIILVENVYISPSVIREGKGHYIDVDASTNIVADVTHRVNLLDNSDMEINNGTIATGWVDYNLFITDIIASHRTGDAQQAEWDGAGSLYYNAPFPIHNGQRVTFSVYAKAGATGFTGSMVLDIRSSVPSTIQQITSAISLSANQEQRLSVSGIVDLPAGYDAGHDVQVYIYSTVVAYSISIDDAQLEMGGLSDYRAY